MGKKSLRLYKYMAIATLVSLASSVVQAHGLAHHILQNDAAPPAGCPQNNEPATDPACEGGSYASAHKKQNGTTTNVSSVPAN